MKKHITFKSAVIIFLSTLLSGCIIHPITPNRMRDCEISLDLDEELEDEFLVGTWEWKDVNCLSNEELDRGIYEGIEVEFVGRDTILVSLNGEILGGIDRQREIPFPGMDKRFYDLRYLHIGNSILFCGNKILFNYTSVDGCDNLFKRKKEKGS